MLYLKSSNYFLIIFLKPEKLVYIYCLKQILCISLINKICSIKPLACIVERTKVFCTQVPRDISAALALEVAHDCNSKFQVAKAEPSKFVRWAINTLLIKEPFIISRGETSR